MSTSVRTYLTSMTGCPQISGTAGSRQAFLRACLVDGFGTVTLTSLIVASGVAAATEGPAPDRLELVFLGDVDA